jgi:CelD/BcsL family acetyltransferase involved in cellulose biosynthesis
MRVRPVPIAELGSSDLAPWAEWYRQDPTLASPYFAPQFTRIVGSVRPAVWGGVVEEADRIGGFLPFERSTRRVGGPVGGPISDYQGVIHRPGLHWRAEELVRSCGLHVFEFDHLLVTQEPFQAYHRTRGDSPVIDLTDGFPSYRRWLRERSQSLVRSIERKSRKIERELGPLRFVCSSEDPAVLHRVIEWKSGQFRRTGIPDLFRRRWVAEVLERILATREPDFAGVLSALYAGDDLIAAHFGMRSERDLHWWFPSFDPTFGRYSPGTVLLWELAKASESGEFLRIDLGKGDDPYKARFANERVWLAEGSIELASWATYSRRVRRKGWSMTRKLARPVVHLARRTGAGLRNLRG